MNILFLVMNFLIIFMFLSGSVLKNASFSSSLKKSSCSYLSSKLRLQSKWERYKYQTYLKDQVVPTQKTERKKITPKIRHTFFSHRFKENISSSAKWNLSPLFSADPHATRLLGALTENLLVELYSHATFWQEAEKDGIKPAEALLHSFLENRAKPETLAALFPPETKLQKIFYKMLKGSGSYDVYKKKGYPPLEDFFTFQVKENTVTNFPFASYPVLKAMFQDSVIETILSLEKNKWEKDQYLHSLTKEELRSLCLGNFLKIKGQRFQDVEPYLQFSHKKAKLEKLTCKDEKAHVQLQMTIPR
jgi:hypothetical protein